jgi:hypothetical protein
MTEQLQKAIELLRREHYTCVLLKDETVYSSQKRGVKPLLELLESNGSLVGFFAADRVVGLGAAHLYLLLGVKELWAEVMSEEAESLLTNHGVTVFAANVVPYIINRQGNGRCPIETAVIRCVSSEDALKQIKETLDHLQKKEQKA